jgi:hypothetical protein
MLAFMAWSPFRDFARAPRASGAFRPLEPLIFRTEPTWLTA